MSCSDVMGVLVGVALLASTVTLILTLLVVLLLWKPDFFHKRWRKQKHAAQAHFSLSSDSTSDSTASPHSHSHPSQLSFQTQQLPPIQEESEEAETLFVSLGTQTDFDTELEAEKHASQCTSPTSPYSTNSGQIRKRSRVSRSSIISNLWLGRKSGDHEQDAEEAFDLMSAEEREHMSNSDEEDEIKDSVFLGVDLQYDQGESSV